MRKFAVLFIAFFLGCNLFAQDSISLKIDSLSISENISDSTIAEDLLPTRYLFTQRLLWGKKGLLRNIDYFKLSPEGRDREMNIRAKVNTVHRYTGYLALAGMIGAGITGQMAANGVDKAKDAHEIIVGVTNASYFTSLGFALFSPPPMKNRETGFTKLNLHRTFSIVHIASMITTNVLAGMIENNSSLVPYHRAAAITAFSSLLIADIIITF
ncbi:MAG: hypothetical protein H6Q16_1395 [Bacteroidetes bacterium]|nr:hypothetical protein [Bacteroidota bacterium]